MIESSYIEKFRARMEARQGGQRTLNDEARNLYSQKHVLEVKAPKDPKQKVRPVGSGRGGFAVDQRVAVLSGNLQFMVAPRGGAQAERHASDTLEPFLNTAVHVMEEDVLVRPHIAKDIVLYGAAFTLGPLPVPSFWATDEMKQYIKDGDTKAIKEYEKLYLPFAWRHMSLPDCLPLFDDRGYVKEFAYKRQMFAGEIVDHWGDDALPNRKRSVGPIGLGTKGYKDDELVDVTDYINGECFATSVGKGDETATALYFEHHMGCTPVASFIGNALPANTDGEMWAGVLYHVRKSIPARDETLSDLRQIVRENTTAPPTVFLNVQERSGLEGWPTHVEVEEGKTVNMIMGESVDRYPVPQMTIDAYKLLAELEGDIATHVEREGLSGTGPSGQSAVHLNQTNQISKAELATYHDGLVRGYSQVGRLILKSVTALSKCYGVEGVEDKVTILAADKKHGMKEIALKPADVAGREHLTKATLDWQMPVNEGANAANYKIAVESGAMDPYTARQVYHNIQNPADIDDRWAEWKLYNAIVEEVIPIAVQRGMGAAAQTDALDAGALMAKAADPGIPSFVGQAFQNLGLEAPGGVSTGRQAGNMARTGGGQQLSELAGVNGASMPTETMPV